jgi:hypothetical protein
VFEWVGKYVHQVCVYVCVCGKQELDFLV